MNVCFLCVARYTILPQRVVRLLLGAFVADALFQFLSLIDTGSSGHGPNTISTTANVLKHCANETLAEYEFVVLGDRQSGLVVANRLSESGEHTGLVVEYGHLYHFEPLIARPWRPYNASANEFHDPKLMYNQCCR